MGARLGGGAHGIWGIRAVRDSAKLLGAGLGRENWWRRIGFYILMGEGLYLFIHAFTYLLMRVCVRAFILCCESGPGSAQLRQALRH